MSAYKTITIAGVILAVAISTTIAASLFYLPSQSANTLGTTMSSFISSNSSSYYAPNSILSILSSNHSSVSPTNPSNSIAFGVSMNSSTLSPGQTLGINVVVFNTLDTENNVTASSSWKFESVGPGFGACAFTNTPYRISVFHGYYTSYNLSQATTPLDVESPLQTAMCNEMYIFQWYLFQPSSNLAISSSCLSNNRTTCSVSRMSVPIEATYSISGYYATNSSSSFQSFNGNYTLVAQDEWGDVLLLHFDSAAS